MSGANDVVLYQELAAQNGKKIGVATLNSEKSLNALSLPMVESLLPQLQAWQADNSISMVLLQGAGDKAFCAGGDIRDLYHNMQQQPGVFQPYVTEFFTKEYHLDYLIHTFDKPVFLRKIFLICLLIPVIGISQPKNIVNVNRVFPKVDKVLEFEKALATHAQKYHTGDVKWRVFEIASGPDAGGFHIVEGPKTWESEDGRGDINVEHNNDWHKNVAIYLTERGTSGYSVYIDSLSTVAVGDYSDKVQITHIYPKQGRGAKVFAMLKNLKKVY